MFDFVADALAKVSHGAAKDLSSLQSLGEELKNGLAIEGKIEAGLFGLLASAILVQCINGFHGRRTPFFQRHVEPVSDAVG